MGGELSDARYARCISIQIDLQPEEASHWQVDRETSQTTLRNHYSAIIEDKTLRGIDGHRTCSRIGYLTSMNLKGIEFW